jgi:hypothetical protein
MIVRIAAHEKGHYKEAAIAIFIAGIGNIIINMSQILKGS